MNTHFSFHTYYFRGKEVNTFFSFPRRIRNQCLLKIVTSVTFQQKLIWMSYCVVLLKLQCPLPSFQAEPKRPSHIFTFASLNLSLPQFPRMNRMASPTRSVDPVAWSNHPTGLISSHIHAVRLSQPPSLKRGIGRSLPLKSCSGLPASSLSREGVELEWRYRILTQ